VPVDNPITNYSYDLGSVKKGIKNPRLFLRELRYNLEALANPLFRRVNSYMFRREHGRGADFVSEDWDTMIILDACRYDVFADRHTFDDGELDSRISRGSNSWMFVKENFEGRQLHDTVYVSANPWSAKLDEGTFHASILLHDEWDAEERTVMPADVTEAARDAHERFPNKRIIVHYMQPHTPYIGSKGHELRDRIPGEHRGWHKYNGLQRDEIGPYTGDKEQLLEGTSIWDAVRDGHVSDDELWEAYCENFDVVADHVSDLLETISGKTVITADHGELLGERIFPFLSKQYSHPWDVKSPELCRVPWFVIEDGERRSVEAAPPVGKEGIDRDMLGDRDIVKQRLRDFGYLQ